MKDHWLGLQANKWFYTESKLKNCFSDQTCPGCLQLLLKFLVFGFKLVGFFAHLVLLHPARSQIDFKVCDSIQVIINHSWHVQVKVQITIEVEVKIQGLISEDAQNKRKQITSVLFQYFTHYTIDTSHHYRLSSWNLKEVRKLFVPFGSKGWKDVTQKVTNDRPAKKCIWITGLNTSFSVQVLSNQQNA